MCLRPSRFKRDGVYYACTVEGCRGSHGAHLDGTPLGIPADQATKKMRIAAHAVFDKLWFGVHVGIGPMRRSEAYAWMRKVMGMTEKEAHIGNFDIPTCKKLIEAAWAVLEPDDDSILPEEWR